MEITILTVVMLLIFDVVGVPVERCSSPQYLELGKPGILNCSFADIPFVISWFNSTSYRTEEPLVELREGDKAGRGYQSGEFDIHKNGSLVIRNVSRVHGHTFSVVKLDHPRENLTPYFIEVVVVEPAYPVVEGCKSNKYCVLQAKDHDVLTCYIRGVPEDVRLEFRVLSPTSEFLLMEQETTVYPVGDHYDVAYSSKFQMTLPACEVVTVECGVNSTYEGIFRDTAILSLLVDSAMVNTSTKEFVQCTPKECTPRWLGICIAVLLAVIEAQLILILIMFYKAESWRRALGVTKENCAM